MKLEGKRVLVFGAGISGIGAADLLCKVGACPVIYDGNDKQDPEAIKAKLEQPENVDIILGELSEEARKTLDLVVMSPGVPTDLPIVKTLRAQGLPIWGEVELAYQMGKGKVLAITGTNGKTTTTAMLGKIMSDYLDSVYVVGNIGTPYTSVALDTKEETVTVAEISSFQLENPGLPTGSQCNFEYHRGSSEPSSYDGRIYPCERTDHQQPDQRSGLCTEL